MINLFVGLFISVLISFLMHIQKVEKKTRYIIHAFILLGSVLYGWALGYIVGLVLIWAGKKIEKSIRERPKVASFNPAFDKKL